MKMTHMLLFFPCVITTLATDYSSSQLSANLEPGYRWRDVSTSKFSYVLPDPVVNLLKPNGFSITVRADKGITELLVFGGLNNESKLSPYRPYTGSIRGRANKINGSFVYLNRDVYLKDGDVCVYHLIAAKDFYLGFCGKYGLRFSVTLHKNNTYTVFQDLDEGS